MNRDSISVYVERKLYAESMGKCMNPNCKKELFRINGDVIEKAHIDPYCKTADNSYENLVVLCPTCHTDFDKNSAFTPDEVKSWKAIRKQELEQFFGIKYNSFDELKEHVVPLLLENQTIYESYYLGDNRALWDKFEPRILINNRKLKTMFLANYSLFQTHNNKDYSNLECINQFNLHVEKFEATRSDAEKIRKVLFPKEINSIFGIRPVHEWMLPLTESLEALITKLQQKGIYGGISISNDHPFITIIKDGGTDIVYLDDTPRLRQLYYDYKCFKGAKVRLDSLLFALSYISHKGVSYNFVTPNNLREIIVNGYKIVFIYEYCLSEVALEQMLLDEGCVVVNLHNWNEESCISSAAYDKAKEHKVKLLTMREYYEFVRNIHA